MARGLEVVEFACGIPHLLKGGFSEKVSTGVDVYSIRQPLGVVAVISPFNFPAMVPLWFVPDRDRLPATPWCSSRARRTRRRRMLHRRAAGRRPGCPTACSTSCTATRRPSTRCSTHPDVKAVSFVGSTPIARYVYETGTAHGKRVQALGGAKNHMVVLPDADLDLAADAAVNAGFGSAGERCMAISVVVAVDPIGDELVAKIAERMAGLRPATARPRQPTWVRWSPRRTATRWPATSTPAVEAAPSCPTLQEPWCHPLQATSHLQCMLRSSKRAKASAPIQSVVRIFRRLKNPLMVCRSSL